MTTTYTPSLRLWEGQPGDVAIRNSWGTALNENQVLLESAILGTAQVNIAGLATYSLTTANGASDQSRPLIQQFTGALTSNCTVTIPNVPKLSQAINATTGGFDVILTSGSGTTIIIPPDGLPYSYQCDGAGDIFITTIQPGPYFGDFKFNGLAVEGGGWRMCYGQVRPRTDPLWKFVIANSIAWPFGIGDGATTYTMPDMRGQALFGIDNMGGTAANRITSAISGIAGTTNGATGGSQSLQAHSHTISITDPGHSHTVNDAGHSHTVNDAGHSHSDAGHSHSDAGHSHSDAGHAHNFTAIQLVGTGTNTGLNGNTNVVNIASSSTAVGFAAIETGFANIEVSFANIQAHVTGVTNNSNTTGITNAAATTGITGTGTATGAGASQNMPPTMMSTCLMFVGA
jgi:hypothetical protein